MFTQLTRFVFATAGALAGLQVKNVIDLNQQIGYSAPTVIVLFVLLGAACGFILGGIAGREITRAFLFFEEYVRHVALSDLIFAVAGMLVGLVVALIVTVPLRALEPRWLSLLGEIGMFIVLGYTGTRISMIKRVDLKAAFVRLGMGEAGGSERSAGMRLLDTSAVIDGRFGALIAAGFLDGEVRVPTFVLSELQTLSDSADDLKRARGRRGLDLLAALRSGEHPVDTFARDYPDIPDVDSKLVKLALDTDSSIVTVDYNLTQVARVQDIDVLNVNDLATALRPNHLPGEVIRIHITREGKESDQGVGHLEDGTMVVVQSGRDLVGQIADVTVTSVLQTSGGRMVFARPRNE